MDKLKIGVFDSGFGALTLLPELNLLKRNIEIFYIADSVNSPYGNREFDFIEARCVELANQLRESSVDIILVACNTGTAHAITTLRQKMDIPIVGIEPFLNFLNINEEEKTNLGVIATEATFSSQKFKDLRARLDPKNSIKYLTCPKLAEKIENIISKKENFDVSILEELGELKNLGLTHLILGCTHYPLIQNQIEKFLNVTCVNPSLPIAKRIGEFFNIELGDSIPEDFTFNFRQSTESHWEIKNYKDYIFS